MSTTFADQLAESAALLAALTPLSSEIDAACAEAVATLQAGNALLTCGNGGSAADALHLAQELVGRYRHNRRALPAICLNADPTGLTCIANDFGYDQVFARAVEALGRPGDLLVVFSTSGNSPNILAALAAAKAAGVRSLALLGKDGGPARSHADRAIIVPSQNTARIQEVHTLILHAMCEAIEAQFPASGRRGAEPLG